MVDFSQNGKFDQIDYFSLKALRRHKKQHWGVAGRGQLLCCILLAALSGGYTMSTYTVEGKRASITKQPFSTTSITVIRLIYYVQMVIGQIIFIEQFCFYSFSGNFCRAWLKDLALRLMYIFFLNVLCHFWNCP